MKPIHNSAVVEICIDNQRQIVSVESSEQYLSTVTRITLGSVAVFPQSIAIVEAIIQSIGPIETVILPKNIPTCLIQTLCPIMEIDGAEYQYLDTNETALGKGLYTMQMGYLPDETFIGCNSTISDGFTPFSDIKQPGTWDGNDGFKPMPGSVDDVSDGFHDDPDTPVEKREMWTEDPERMNRLGYLPLAYARGERMMPPELGGGAIRQ